MSLRKKLDRDIRELHLDIIKMGILAEESIDDTIKALMNKDLELMEEVIKRDDAFDNLEVEIENKCISIIAMQQPVATDLRRVLSIHKISSDIERIADNCADICFYAQKLANVEYVKPLIDIPKMGEEVTNMLKMAVDSYIESDVDKAIEVIKNDDVVDEYFKGIFSELSNIISKNPEKSDQCLNFLMIAKYLERMADHTTNISEWVVYIVDGKRI